MSRAGRGRDRFGPSLLKSAWEASRCFGEKKTRRDRPDAWSEALPCLTAIAVLRRESGRDGSRRLRRSLDPGLRDMVSRIRAQASLQTVAGSASQQRFPSTAHFARTARTNWPTAWLHGCGKKHAHEFRVPAEVARWFFAAARFQLTESRCS